MHQAFAGHQVEALQKTYLENPKYQAHCREKDNAYCCADIDIVNPMEFIGRHCEKAQGYKHNREPEEENRTEPSETKHDGHPEGHRNHRKAPAKVRVQNKPLIPKNPAPAFKIPEVFPKIPNEIQP